MTSGRSIRWSLWIPVAIVVLTVTAYLNALGHPFIFDDAAMIVNNPDMRHLFPLHLGVRWLVNFSFKLNYAMGQLRVADYRATNLLIHIVAALLLYGFVRRTLPLPVMGGRWTRHAPVLAGTIALLWAVHPLQTESVTYICQRYESLMGLFYLGTFYLFVRGTQAGTRQRAAGWFGGAVVCCLLGMGSKEIMVTAPFLVLVYDMLLVGPTWRDALRKRWLVHVGLWATVGVFELQLQQMLWAAERSVGGATLAIGPLRYLLTQMQVIPHYLRLSVIPYPLCLDYGWPFVQNWRAALLPGLFLTGVGVLTLVLWIRRRPEAFLGLWFFCILAPTSSVVSIPDAAFEHRMYLPLAAVIAAVVLGGYRVLRKQIKGRALVVLVLVLALVGVGLTCRRNHDYRSDEDMWANVVHHRPENRRARLNYSSALLDARQVHAAEREARVVAEQLAYCQALEAKAIPAWPQDDDEVKRYQDARHYAIAHNLMGVASVQQGKREAAASHFAEAVRLLPQFQDAARNLKRLHAE